MSGDAREDGARHLVYDVPTIKGNPEDQPLHLRNMSATFGPFVYASLSWSRLGLKDFVYSMVEDKI